MSKPCGRHHGEIITITAIEKNMNNRRGMSGFTIVELLIVIVVIAILATITVVAFNGIENRAVESTVLSDLNTFKKKIEIAKMELGYYPRSYSEFPADLKITKSAYDTTQNNIYYSADTVNEKYAFGVRAKTKKGYILTNSGLQEGVTVNGAKTAEAIDLIWGGVGTASIAGYTTTSPTKWTVAWSLVN